MATNGLLQANRQAGRSCTLLTGTSLPACFRLTTFNTCDLAWRLKLSVGGFEALRSPGPGLHCRTRFQVSTRRLPLTVLEATPPVMRKCTESRSLMHIDHSVFTAKWAR